MEQFKRNLQPVGSGGYFFTPILPHTNGDHWCPGSLPSHWQGLATPFKDHTWDQFSIRHPTVASI